MDASMHEITTESLEDTTGQAPAWHDRLWFFWQQGAADLPPIARACLRSWQVHNPTAQIIVLDGRSILDFIPDAETHRVFEIPSEFAARSDLYRLNFLKHNGGVWIDIDCVCRQPLTSWLPAAAPNAFFAFDRPAADRPVATWFLAASAHHPIIEKWADLITDYWRHSRDRRLLHERRRQCDPFLFFLRRRPGLWYDKRVYRYWNVYPYFIMNYTFSRLLESDAEFRSAWQRTGKISADGPHLAKRLDLTSRATAEKRARIYTSTSPLFKLNRRVNESALRDNTVVNYVLRDYLGEAP